MKRNEFKNPSQKQLPNLLLAQRKRLVSRTDPGSERSNTIERFDSAASPNAKDVRNSRGHYPVIQRD
jgi:hypothetical protein